MWYQSMMKMKTRVEGLELEMLVVKGGMDEMMLGMGELKRRLENIKSGIKTIKKFLRDLRESTMARD